MICEDCGEYTDTSYSGVALCNSCYTKRKHDKVDEQANSVTSPSDLDSWESGDRSELFWLRLSKYLKEPNPRSLDLMRNVFYWVCHEDHDLSNSFKHALDWAGLDLLTGRMINHESD